MIDSSDETPTFQETLVTLEGLIADAKRWRALMATARMRPIGSAGLTSKGERDPASTGWVHFGMEFWSAYAISNEQAEAADSNNAWARNALIALTDETMAGVDADAGVRAKEADEKQRLFDAAIILGQDVQYILLNLEAYGMNDACEMAPTDGRPLDPERTHKYLVMKKLINDDATLTSKGVILRDFIVNNADALESFYG